MYSTAKLALVFFYFIAIIYGFGYVIFFRGASPWWWILCVLFCPNPNAVAQLAKEPDDKD